MDGVTIGQNGKPRWAPRAPQPKLRRLYEGVATGLVDDTLVDDVGLTLYLRCRSILLVQDIHHRRILPCPSCGRAIALPGPEWPADSSDVVLSCDACSWTLPWSVYRETFRHQELWAEGASDICKEYVCLWKTARSQTDKFLAIDRVIHRWHWETTEPQPSFGVGRPTGVNLIEGSRKAVIAFLDGLTYGQSSPVEATTARDAWRERWRGVKERQTEARAVRGALPGAWGSRRRVTQREGD